MKRPHLILIPAFLLYLLALAAVYFSEALAPFRLYILAGLGAAGLIAFLIAVITVSSRNRQLLRQMDSVASDNTNATSRILAEFSVPCLFVDRNGNVTWRNSQMEKICRETNLRALFPKYNFRTPPAAINLEYGSGSYQVMSMKVDRKSADNPLIFQYWIDRSEAAHYEKLYEENRPYIGLIYVDNLDDLLANQQFRRTEVLTEIERLVASYVAAINGIYRKYENGLFIVVFESKHLAELENERFRLLDSVRELDTGTSTPVTLSISVGVADQLQGSDESAKQALELALGRGGDQCVVKRGSNYSFYGGKHQIVSQQSRVKARLFSSALRQMFESTGNVFVMGHLNCDIDALGAGIGIVACAKMLPGRRAYFVLDKVNDTIRLGVNTVESAQGYGNCIITPDQAKNMIHPDSVLVIVDTQRTATVCCPDLLKLTDRIILIDHHRRSADYIDSSTLHLMESRASSASELVTEVIQYFDEKPAVPPFVCTLLLAGITLDTKHFAFNVGSRTFEAAGYLRKNGADIGLVKKMFRDDLAGYLSCADAIKNAEILGGKIALTVCPKLENSEESEKIVSAKISDQLINIKGIEAGFALGHDGNVISVSARSLGVMNVQIICERLGGGGHLMMAGAQLPNRSMEEAYALVKQKIEEYLKEVEQ